MTLQCAQKFLPILLNDLQEIDADSKITYAGYKEKYMCLPQ